MFDGGEEAASDGEEAAAGGAEAVPASPKQCLVYENMAVTVDPQPPFAITGVGPTLPLECPPNAAAGLRVCFSSGLRLHGDKVLVSYGAGDNKAMLWSLSWDAFREHYLP